MAFFYIVCFEECENLKVLHPSKHNHRHFKISVTACLIIFTAEKRKTFHSFLTVIAVFTDRDLCPCGSTLLNLDNNMKSGEAVIYQNISCDMILACGGHKFLTTC